MNNLERELVDLNGQLRALLPALERLDVRVREVETKEARGEVKLESVRSDFNEFRKQTETLLKETGDLIRDVQTAQGDQGSRIAAIQERGASLGSKVWDVVKVILAAAAGILATRYFGGGRS